MSGGVEATHTLSLGPPSPLSGSSTGRGSLELPQQFELPQPLTIPASTPPGFAAGQVLSPIHYSPPRAYLTPNGSQAPGVKFSGVVEWYDNGKGFIKPSEGPGIYFHNVDGPIKKYDIVEYELKEEGGRQVADKVSLSARARPTSPSQPHFQDTLKSYLCWEDYQVLGTINSELEALRKRVEVLTQEVEAKNREATQAVERLQLLEGELGQSRLTPLSLSPVTHQELENERQAQSAREAKALRQRQYDSIQKTLANWEMLKCAAADILTPLDNGNSDDIAATTTSTTINTNTTTTNTNTNNTPSMIPKATTSSIILNITTTAAAPTITRNNSGSSSSSEVHSQKRASQDSPSNFVRKRSKILSGNGSEQGHFGWARFIDEQIAMQHEVAAAQVHNYMCDPSATHSNEGLDVTLQTVHTLSHA